jgi:hypothetical protein
MLGASLERSSIDQRELDDAHGLRRILNAPRIRFMAPPFPRSVRPG